jgi:hypothetical protein
MTRERMGMGEGFGAERLPAEPGQAGIAQSAERTAPESDAMRHALGATRRYSLRLLLIPSEQIGQANVRPAADLELASLELAETEIPGFIREAAGWAQAGLKSRKAVNA